MLFSASSRADLVNFNQFWQDLEPFAKVTLPESFEFSTSRLSYSIGYENSIAKQEESGFADAHWRKLELQTQKTFGQLKVSALIESEGFEFEAFKPEDNSQIRWTQSNQQLNAGLNVDSQWLGLGLVTNEGQQGFSVQLNPTETTKLFYKKLDWRHYSQIDAQFTTRVDGAFLSGAEEKRFQVHNPQELICEQQGWGGRYHSEKGQLFLQHLNDDERSCNESAVLFNWQLSPHWQLSGQLNQMDKQPQKQLIFIDSAVKGQTSTSLKSDYHQLGLTYLGGREYTLNLSHRHLNLNYNGRFDASAMAGYWSSLFVGDGVYDVSLKTDTLMLELASQANAKEKGWVGDYAMGWIRSELDGGSSYKVYPWPFGKALDEDNQPLEFTFLEALSLRFKVGYRWKNWRVSYEMFQPIPLRTESREETPLDVAQAANTLSSSSSANQTQTPENTPQETVAANGGSNDSEAKDFFADWPSANRQMLRIEYLF